MAVKRIDSIYDVQSIAKEQQQVVESLTEAQKKIIDLYNTIQQYKGADFVRASEDAKKLAQALKESSKATTEAAKANSVLEKSQQAIAKTREQNAKALKAEIAAENEVVKQITLEDRAQQASNKTKDQAARSSQQKEKSLAAERKMMDQLTDEYALLSKALKDQERRYTNLALTQGEQSQAALEALEVATKTRDVLNRLDGNLRNYQRNVGNYKSAYDGLGTSFQQLTRELPALAIGVNTFTLAISNNLPFFFDQIKAARQEIAALQAAGQPTPTLFQRISGSIFSAGTALSIGITLLTVFSKQIFDFVGGLFDANSALKKHEEELFKTTEAYIKLRDAQRDFFSTIDTFLGTAEYSLNNQLKLAQAQGKERKELLQIEKDIAAQRLIQAQREFEKTEGFTTLELRKQEFFESELAFEEFLRTRVEGEKQLSDEEFNEAEKRKRTQLNLLKSQYEDQKKVVEDYSKAFFDFKSAESELESFTTEESKKRAKERRDFIFETNKALLEDAIRTYDELAKNSSILSIFREDSALKAFQLRNQLVDLTARHEKDKERITNEEIVKIDTDAMIARKQNNKELEQDRQKILIDRIEFDKKIVAEEKKIFGELDQDIKQREEKEKQAQEDQKQGLKGLLEFEIDQIKKAEQIKLTEIQIAADTRQAELNKQRESGLISEKKYAEESAKIQKKAASDALAVSISSAQQQLKLLETAGLAGTAAYDALRKAIAAAQRQQSSFTSGIDDDIGKLQKQLQLINDTTRSFTDAINTIADIGFNTRQAALETEKNQVEEQSEREIRNIENSTLAEEEKQIRIQKAQAITDAKKQEIERRQRQIDVERARFQKASDIANIITTTALAVVSALTQVKTLGPGAYALAAAVGALGAAQLAAAIATPLPQFYKGTDDAPEGWALTDERGAEGYVEPSGKAYIGNDRPTLRYLKKGTKIIPHDKLNKSVGINSMLIDIASMIKKPDLTLPDSSNDNRNTDRIVKAIRASKPKNSVVKVDLGFASYIERNVYK